MHNLIESFIKELKEWKKTDDDTYGSAGNLVSIVNEFLDDLADEEELEDE